jgi:protein TonB
MIRQASGNSHPAANDGMTTWPNVSAGAMAGGSWGRGVDALRAKELSLVAHLLAAVLLLFPLYTGFMNRPGREKDIESLGKIIFPGMPPVKAAQAAEDPTGGGGGGDHNLIAARQGGLPRFSWLQKSPPEIIRNLNPKIPVEATLLGPPEIPVPATKLYGDPLSLLSTDSQGPGSDGGFGRGKRGGIGDGDGGGAGKGNQWGFGGEGEPQWPGRNGVGFPECSYCPTPSFSEEARKTKTQGAVSLQIVVGTDGRASNIRVVRGLGMGLDERAIAAVRSWRFKAALGPGGKPVPTEVLIEVTFRLL